MYHKAGWRVQVLLNSLRRLLTVVPQTEHTLSRWCGGPDGQRPGSPNAGPPSPNRDGPPPPGALTKDGPGECLPFQPSCIMCPCKTPHTMALSCMNCNHATSRPESSLLLCQGIVAGFSACPA